MSQLKDKVIVITGAAGGIGNSAAQLMASRGAKLVLADVVLGPAQGLAEELRAVGVEAIAVEFLQEIDRRHHRGVRPDRRAVQQRGGFGRRNGAGRLGCGTHGGADLG